MEASVNTSMRHEIINQSYIDVLEQMEYTETAILVGLYMICYDFEFNGYTHKLQVEVIDGVLDKKYFKSVLLDY